MNELARPAHTLKREKSMTIPRHFIFFDTETYQTVTPDGDIQQDFKLGWACYWRRAYGRHREITEWFYLETPSMFWDFIYSKSLPKQRLWIIARNIVFDFTVCKGWKHLNDEGYKLKFFHNNGVSVIVTVKKQNRSIVFLDSMNWFPESLEKTGQRIGIPKMKIDFDTCTMQELSDYCRNDVRIEYENIRIFVRFLQSNNISRMCYTRASTAMAAYLTRHYHKPIFIHNNAKACQLERESYKGGRCECFYIGDLNHETYYVLDVNSLYPFCMANNSYPTKYKQLLHTPKREIIQDRIQNSSIVAKVQIETDQPVYAVKDSRTIFPVGTFDVTLCTPELKYALDNNHVKKIYDAVIYKQGNIFHSFVETFYSMRQEFKADDNEAYDQLCKYIMNSLYGKFGQKAEHWKKIGDAPNEPDREEMIFCNNPRKITRLRYLLGQVFMLTGYSESFNSFPAISAHVTAYGRMYLWSLMQIAGHGNYYYCDTDSLIVNGTGYVNLYAYLNDTELGKLKREETLTHFTIHGLKDYEKNDKRVIKGIRKTAVYLGNNVYRQELWPTFKGTLKTSDANIYTVKHITKHLSREYTKGIVNNDGRVTPFVLSQT